MCKVLPGTSWSALLPPSGSPCPLETITHTAPTPRSLLPSALSPTVLPGQPPGPSPTVTAAHHYCSPQLLLASWGRCVLVEDLQPCHPIHRHFCLRFCSPAPFAITSHRLGALNTLSWTITSYLLSVTCIQSFLCPLPLTSLKSLSFDFSFSLELELFRFYSPPYPAF